MLRHEAEATPGETGPQATDLGEAPKPPVVPPQSGARGQNRVLALTLASVAAFVFVTAIILVVLLHHVESHQVFSQP